MCSCWWLRLVCCVAVAVVATGLYGNSGVGDLILSESVCSSIIGPLGVLLNIELTFSSSTINLNFVLNLSIKS